MFDLDPERSYPEAGHSQSADPEGARLRLIHAAAELFAAKGLAATSIREITDRASTNVASVNYYFGSKDKLYLETLRHMFLQMTDMHEGAALYLRQALDAPGDLAVARESLRRFIQMFVYSVAYTGPQFDLMLRELVEPTGAMEHIFREFIWPLAAVLDQLVQFVQPRLANNAAERRSYCESIVALCLNVRHQQNMERAQNMPPPTKQEVEDRARFTAEFCLKALS